MREKFQKQLDESRGRFLKELDVSGTFIAELLEKDVITAEHKAIIQSKGTTEEKVDSLIDILKRRSDSKYYVFCDLLKNHNEDFADLFTGSSRPGLKSVSSSTPKQKQDNEKLQSKHQTNILKNTTDDSPIEQILDMHMQILDYLDPRYGLLDQLYAKRILNDEAFAELGNLKNPSDCCRKLLRHLKKTENIEKSLNCFKEILQKDHSWIYDTIWRDANDVSDTNNRPLSKDERRKIIFNEECFIKLIDPCKHQFLSKLGGSDCITERQFESLKNQFDKETMVSELLSILVRRSFVHFQSFQYWLKFTLQDNIVKVLESNGVVLKMKVDLEKNDLRKPIVDLLTGTVGLDDLQLDADDKTVVKDIFEFLEKRKLIIVGGACGSLIVYILCMTVEAVTEMKKLYETKELETKLNTLTILNVTIQIDEEEFGRCRSFFSEHDIHDCKSISDPSTDRPRSKMHFELLDKRLNEFPEELFEIIMKRASWMMWVCFVIKTLIPGSSTPLNNYLKKGVRGFLNFVKVFLTDIFCKLSSVCIPWRDMLTHKRYGKTIKTELLLKISRMAIKRSKNILIADLCVHDGLLELSLEEKLIAVDEKTNCELMPEKSNEMFVGFLYNIDRRQIFVKLMKFLFLLEEQCKCHLANHVISFGVHWPNFEKRWPLEEKTKLLINTACGSDLILRMDINEIVHSVENKLEHTTTAGIEGASYNLVYLLFKHNCITADQRDALRKLKNPDKLQKLMNLLKNGSTEMFEIVIDYLNETGQDSVVHLLQPIQEVRIYGRYIVNCLKRATEILNDMIAKNKISSSLLDHFSINGHTVHSDQFNNFQKNEIVLNVLECCKSDVYIYFLNFLLTNNQHEMLLPMFQSIPHSMLLEKFESYLIDSIDADEDLLRQLLEFNVINHTQMRTINSKRTSIERNRKLLKIVFHTPPKSFSLFLTALAQTGRSNILVNMQLMHSEPDSSSAANDSVVYEQIEMVVDADQEIRLDVVSNLVNIPPDVADNQNISSYEETIDSEERSVSASYNDSYSIRDDKDHKIDFKLEEKSSFRLNLKTVKRSSSATSGIIKTMTSLPDDIQNLLFLKKAILRKRPEVDVRIGISQYLSPMLGYLANIMDKINSRNTQCSYFSASDKLSMMINPEEVARMKELKLRTIIDHLSEILITSIDPSGYVLQTLTASGVLTSQHKTAIELMPNKETRAERLLSILSTSEHVGAYRVFVEALKHKHAELVQVIDGMFNPDSQRLTDNSKQKWKKIDIKLPKQERRRRGGSRQRSSEVRDGPRGGRDRPATTRKFRPDQPEKTPTKDDVKVEATAAASSGCPISQTSRRKEKEDQNLQEAEDRNTSGGANRGYRGSRRGQSRGRPFGRGGYRANATAAYQGHIFDSPYQYFYAAPTTMFYSSPSAIPFFGPQVYYPLEIPEAAALRHLIEYYFSDKNLEKDFFMRRHMDKEGWVELALLKNFRRVRDITQDDAFIIETMKQSITVETSENKKSLRSKVNPEKWTIKGVSPDTFSALKVDVAEFIPR